MTDKTNTVTDQPIVVSDRGLEMAAFDSLPSRIRAVLRDAPENYSALDVAGLWRRTRMFGNVTVDQFAAYLRREIQRS